MKIIVTGSLGNISDPLARELLQDGHEVTIISSDMEKIVKIEALGAIAAIGSVQDAGFLTEAFSGAEAAYTMIPPNFAAPDPLAYYELIGSNYAAAIERSPVKRIVNLSSWGAHLAEGTGIIAGAHRVETILNQLTDMNVTHLRPCSFYNNLYQFVDMIKTAGVIGTNYGGEDRLVMVSTTDIAAAAAEEITLPTTGNKIRYIASDERTCTEIAAVLGAAMGKPGLQWLTLADAQVKAALEKNGLPPQIAGKLVELNAAIHSGLMREDYDRHRPDAMGKVKLEAFAKEFAAAFH